ncbi:hypothetical protein H2204_013558 [Knufia peltigerae]|uniref:Uncharacterized protein n=1 Tax=Knufia peltigerae TaxID=1002370 RepID=A0AA38XQD1_9EURO|nr:hypothetical protein H2204_013558 [Knufia peltigerae]
MSSIPVTEILYLDVDPKSDLRDADSDAGRVWREMLELARTSPGFRDQYWGRGHEFPEKVRLHIVRDTLEQHRDFKNSESGQMFFTLAGKLVRDDSAPVVVRHVLLHDTELNDGRRLAREAPITGSALYVNSDDVFHDYVWPLWTHIVRHAPGNQGVAGGRVLDHESGRDAYLVYVGWETNDDHQRFRQSPLCADRRVILKMGNDAQEEYYHVVFEKKEQMK